ncbi:hypothetical protein ACHAWX_000360 [Stephanocyclus meneghinianus]
MCLPTHPISFKAKTGEYGSSTKRTLSNQDHTRTVSVPTFVEKPEEQIEVTSLNSSNIAALKTNDPFMYYSIPTARNSAMKGKEVDTSFLHCGALSSTPASDREARNGKAGKISRIVTRQRRVSAECHPSLIWAEMLCVPDVVAAMSTQSECDDLEYVLLFLESMTR